MKQTALKPARKKKCKHCGDQFTPFNSMQQTCTKVECCVSHGRKLQKKENRKAKKEFYDNDRSVLMEKAKTACHKYIRERDRDDPCISCGRYDYEIKESLTGGKWDAGHWKSRGARPELRFNEYNIHKQCKSCNGGAGKWSKKDHTVSQSYKINLIEKIGLRHVEWLECHNESKKLSLDDLREIALYYKNKLKELIK